MKNSIISFTKSKKNSEEKRAKTDDKKHSNEKIASNNYNYRGSSFETSFINNKGLDINKKEKKLIQNLNKCLKEK